MRLPKGGVQIPAQTIVDGELRIELEIVLRVQTRLRLDIVRRRPAQQRHGRTVYLAEQEAGEFEASGRSGGGKRGLVAGKGQADRILEYEKVIIVAILPAELESVTALRPGQRVGKDVGVRSRVTVVVTGKLLERSPCDRGKVLGR